MWYDVHLRLEQSICCWSGVARSSESCVDADFELVEVDVTWRQTDRTNGVGVGDCAGQLEQANVASNWTYGVVRVLNHSGHTGVDDVWVGISRQNSSQSHLQLRRRNYLIPIIIIDTVRCGQNPSVIDK